MNIYNPYCPSCQANKYQKRRKIMTERNFSTNNRMWWGVVEDVNDPDQEGRCRVRIHGIHDDETNIPTDQLPWCKPVQDITSAGHNKIGSIPVGLIVGSTVHGWFMDEDQQYPIMIGTISKAGDPQNAETVNGSETIIPGTNSSPPGGRITNNSCNTRANQNIGTDDATAITYPVYSPPQQKDADGKDITAEAIDKTKYANIPTVASITNPSGQILSQLQNVDPQNLNGVLKNAIPSLIKMLDLNTFSSSSGSLGVLGQALGQALTSIAGQLGASTVINALGAAMSGANLSSNASQALYIALMNLNQSSITSLTVQQVINLSLQSLIALLTPLLKNGTLTATQFETLIALYLEEIQGNGSQATLGQGITPQSILSVLSQVLPTIVSAIDTTLDVHLPKSVLNPSIITQAIQKFSMNQAFLKAPENGRKALAILATTGLDSQMNAQIASAISSVEGVTAQATSVLSKIFN
jgi:hypothetical protein